MCERSETPLYDRLSALAGENTLRFHMPGHKGKTVFPPGPSLESLDYTELDRTGNMYADTPPFSELNSLFARDYGAAHSFVIAGGSTQGIFAMLAAAARGAENRKIVCDRGAHRSVYNAMAVNRLEPVYICPDIAGPSPFCNIAARFDEAAFDNMLAESSAFAVLITSPTYYGVIRDIKSLAQIAHSHGALLLVDEAHGAHLPYLGNRASALSLGADMSVCSLHKTLRALGGAALLNASRGFNGDDIRDLLSVYGSSSPSYLVLVSADLARADAASHRDALARTALAAESIRKSIGAKTPFAPLGREHCAPGTGYDPLRLTVNTALGGLSGDEAAAILSKNGIVCEMSDVENLVFIITHADAQDELQTLENALLALGAGRVRIASEPFRKPPLPEQVLPLWDVLHRKTERVALMHAKSRVCAGIVSKTPPCVPLAAPGELLTEDMISYMVASGLDPQGHVCVIKRS